MIFTQYICVEQKTEWLNCYFHISKENVDFSIAFLLLNLLHSEKMNTEYKVENDTNNNRHRRTLIINESKLPAIIA